MYTDSMQIAQQNITKRLPLPKNLEESTLGRRIASVRLMRLRKYSSEREDGGLRRTDKPQRLDGHCLSHSPRACVRLLVVSTRADCADCAD